MNSNVLLIREETTIKEMLALISHYQIRDFPIVNSGGQFVGMVYEKHLLQALYPKIESFSEGGFDYSDLDEIASRFKDMPVGKLVTKGMKTVSPDDFLLRAGTKMLVDDVASIAVLEDEKAVGMITQSMIFSVLMNYVLKKHGLRHDEEIKKPPKKIKKELERRDRYTGPEQRLYRRVAWKMPVAYKVTNFQGEPVTGSQGKIGESVDVSAGGMFLRVKEKLERNTMLDVAFDLFRNNRPFVRLCRVVRCQESRESGVYDLGLMFLALSVEERKKIENYLERY